MTYAPDWLANGTARELRLGTQGWSYQDWVGPFYPPSTRPTGFLPFYARVFDCVELDSTFYGPPRPATVRSWLESTPPGFIFTAKMPKSVTHDKRLVGTEADLLEFLTAMVALGDRLGPVLIQLPPSFDASARGDLERFLEILPEEFRYAIEFRHRSWLTDGTATLLQAHNLAWVIVDLYGMPRSIRLTTDFTYIRWLGRRSDITRLDRIRIDRSDDLAHWATELDRIAERALRIYGFVNNHYAGHSPASVNELKQKLGLPLVDPRSLWPERQLALDLGEEPESGET